MFALLATRIPTALQRQGRELHAMKGSFVVLVTFENYKQK